MNKIKVKFYLGIGYSNANQEDAEVFDEEDVPTDPIAREEWLQEVWDDWAANYICGSAWIVEDDEEE